MAEHSDRIVYVDPKDGGLRIVKPDGTPYYTRLGRRRPAPEAPPAPKQERRGERR